MANRDEASGKKINLYAVFGKPISHSLSPLLHNQAFQARGRSAYYIPVECGPEEAREKLQAFRLLGGQGLNLTRPLKEVVLPWITPTDLWVKAAGAANTLVLNGDNWEAANTDCEALYRLLPSIQSRSDALILGAGGVARATAAVLSRRGFQVVVAARRPGLCDWASEVISWEERLAARSWDVVVNATPLGQLGEPDQERWPLPVSRGVAVDWVYRPNNTRFIQAARSRGAHVIDGMTLFMEQAALAWLVWFGEEGPRGVMREVVAPWR